jgi:hypothetical protein
MKFNRQPMGRQAPVQEKFYKRFIRTIDFKIIGQSFTLPLLNPP